MRDLTKQRLDACLGRFAKAAPKTRNEPARGGEKVFGAGFGAGLYRASTPAARNQPVMTFNSTARSRAILRVTVPIPAEFSVKTPSFNGFAFVRQFYVWL